MPAFEGVEPAGRTIDFFKGVDSKAWQIGFRMETSQEFGKAEWAEWAERRHENVVCWKNNAFSTKITSAPNAAIFMHRGANPQKAGHGGLVRK